MRLTLIDTLATIVFFTIVASATELFIAGMEPREVLMTRAIMIPIMVLTGRPYGAWRDAIFGRTMPRNALTRTLIDILAFLSFQVPVYVLTLWIAGATLAEVLAAVGSAIVFMVLLSRPFGLFLEWLRRLAGAPARSPASDAAPPGGRSR